MSAIWQGLLDVLGTALAWIYDLIPNYGVSIIVMTVVIKLLLLPLGIKQIKSMQHMQAIQPKLKELQRKYKGNRQKMQEEQMKLYKEAGVNPLGGCLPLLLQFPILIAMYSVLRPIPIVPVDPASPTEFQVHNNHLPEDSTLFANIVQHQDTDFLFMDLQCGILQVGQVNLLEYQDAEGNAQPIPPGEPILGEEGEPLPFDPTTKSTLDCGDARVPDVIPYGILLAIMVASGFVQQRQMTKASPPGAQSSQQQAIMKVFPLMFAFFGLSFPAGLVLYWTVSNLFTISQQTFLLRAGHIGPDAIERRKAEQAERAKNGPAAAKPTIMERMMTRAESAQTKREAQKGRPSPPPKSATAKGSKGETRSKGKVPPKPGSRPNRGSSKGAKPGNQLRKRPPGDDGTGSSGGPSGGER